MKEQIEKQAIEEMAKVIEITEQIARDAHCGLPSPTMYAKDLYWKGYRKQSEWISVDERLPEEGKNVLCFDGDKTSIAFMGKVEDCGTYVTIFWDFDFYDRDDTWNEVCATHWMPLPEPPKKGKVTAESAIKSLQEAAHELKVALADDSFGISSTMQF